jgi:Acyltransferase family
VAYLDNLKVALVAVIIVGHSLVGYSGFKGAWPYQDVREVSLGAVSQAVVAIPVLPGVLFTMGLFFLISGLLTPESVVRKGPGRFARDRIVRLGVPLAIWILGIWTALQFAIHREGQDHWTFWDALLHRHPLLDPGPMWFVEILLIYSLGYAVWRYWRQHHPSAFATPSRLSADGDAPLRGKTLVLLAAGISVATILVRPVFPFTSAQIGQIKLWQWPQYLGMFGLGVVAAQRGWLDPVPSRIRRRCGQAVLLALMALLLLFAANALAGNDTNVFGRRFYWAPTALAALEGPLVVGTCVWLLGFAQQHLNRQPGALGRGLARSAFAAFILQGAIIIGLEIALRPLAVPAEVKAIIVAGGAVVGSFSLAWVLVCRTPIGRVL